jgi:uncharacterized protein (TIGR04540 family)
MDILRNPVTVKLLAQQIKTASDSCIARKLTEKQFRELMHHYARNHGNMLFSKSGINSTIVNRIGKKRLSLVNIMLDGFQMSIIE